MAAADGPLPVVALEVDDLTCPLTQELFVSPVSCSCGHTFNKSELRRCLARQELECPLAAPLPRVPTGGERVVTLACGHAYDRDLIKQLIEMKHDKCIVCSGQVMPPTAALLKTTRHYAKLMAYLSQSSHSRDLEEMGPGDRVVLQEEEAAHLLRLLTCEATGALLSHPVSLPCGCTFSREALVERVEAGQLSCPGCSRLNALPPSVHGLRVNLGLASILRALQPSVAGTVSGSGMVSSCRPLLKLQDLAPARVVPTPRTPTAGFLPPSSLLTGRGARHGGQAVTPVLEPDQLDFLVGYEGEREAGGRGLPHGTGRWRGVAAGGRRMMTYEGQWARGRFEGQGTLTFNEDCTYTGEWLRGRFHGRGTLRTPSWTYEGSFSEGERVKGRTQYANREVFCGWWDRGSKLSGTYHYGNGDVFKGRFVLERPLAGIMSYADGRIYQGSFGPSGLPEGSGTLRFPDGSVYQGDLHAGRPGSCRVRPCPSEPDGCVIERATGSGSMRYAAGHIYTGQFKDGQWHGSGLLKLKLPGRKPLVYIGDWAHGYREGKGRLYQGAGRVLEGVWVRGRRVRLRDEEQEEEEEEVEMEGIVQQEGACSDKAAPSSPVARAPAPALEAMEEDDDPALLPVPVAAMLSSSSIAASPPASPPSSPVVPSCRIDSSVAGVMLPSASSPCSPTAVPSPSSSSSAPSSSSSPLQGAPEASTTPLLPDEDLADRSPTSAA